VLRLDADSKLPASITGDADTVDGKHASDLVLVSDIVTEAVANKILKLNADSKLPASITGDADTVDGKHATAFQEVAEKDQPGGYAGLDNDGALKSKIRSIPLYDFNTATIGGLYVWDSSTLNAPVPSGGTALVIDRSSSAYLTQIAIRANSAILYIRFSTNTSNTEWTDWKRLDKTPVGTIITYPVDSIPSHCLECNGAMISRETYSELFAVIGTLYGTGDGSTTFNLPDLRGEFIRGFDNGRGIDSGRAFGSAQGDEFKSHSHPVKEHVVSYSSTGRILTPNNGSYTPSPNGIGATGGTETRPRNIAMMFCIVYE
jgi:microcystin-dependent protein